MPENSFLDELSTNSIDKKGFLHELCPSCKYFLHELCPSGPEEGLVLGYSFPGP